MPQAIAISLGLWSIIILGLSQEVHMTWWLGFSMGCSVAFALGILIGIWAAHYDERHRT